MRWNNVRTGRLPRKRYAAVNAQRKRIFSMSEWSRRASCNVTAMRMTAGTTVAAALAALVTSTLPALVARLGAGRARAGGTGGRRPGGGATRRSKGGVRARERRVQPREIRRRDRRVRTRLRALAAARDPVQPRSVLPEAVGGGAAERARSPRPPLLRGRRPRGAVVKGPARRRPVHHGAGTGGRRRGGARAAGEDRRRQRRRRSAACPDDVHGRAAE